MLKHSIKHFLLISSLLIVSSVFSFAVLAQTDRADQTIEIDADYSSGSLKQRNLTYRTNVIIKQGELTIRADEVRVMAEKGLETLLITGSPAVLEQRQENGKLVSAEAKAIDYDVNQRILTLTDSAELKDGNNAISSSRIVFDINAQEYYAGDKSSKNERVKAVFTPSELSSTENQSEE